MIQILRTIVWAIGKLILSLRYRVRVHGLEKVRGLQHKTLILPNHPGMIDPPIVLTALWPALHPRPLVYEGNFRNPVLRPLMSLLDAVRVPDLERPNVEAHAQTQQAIRDVIDSLQRGQNVILWPSGMIQRDGVERLGPAQALTDILRAVPDVNLVLVRTRGVWGSRFTYAPTGAHPDLLGGLWAGIGWLLASGLFFMPRRRMDLTVEVLDRSKLPELTRQKVNPFFEAWYNQGGPETPTFVPYHHLFGPRTFTFPARVARAELDLSKVTPATRTAVAQILEEKLHRPLSEEELQPGASLDQLGLSSLDRMDLALTVEQRFGFSGDHAPLTIGEVWALAQGLVERAPIKPPPPEWFQPPSDIPAEIHGETVAEAFLTRALAHPKDVAVADDLTGVVKYERMLVGAVIMARRLARLPAANVGLMLPASVVSDAAFLGMHLVGKLPVLLNWTTGPANLAHAARVMNLTHVVTSRAFLNRSGVRVEGVETILVEDLRKSVSRLELLRTFLQIRWLPGSVRRRMVPASPDQPAVVLFTSGSEKAPKAVPLTHRNLLTNQRGSIAALGVNRTDSILGFLPAFHSFGLSVTGLLPLLGGLRVVRHPDPTDAAGLARKVAAYKPTILVGTPTFVSYIVDRARPGELESLRLIVVGAEKCPQELFERCRQAAPQASLVEGYGITECSPVVSVNRPGSNRPGTIGQPLPDVEVAVVDMDSGEPLPAGERGMLEVSGPTVFPGYFAYDGPSPFRERDGKRWYITADLGSMDAEGFITFSGRLKRFLKAGGEMISLPALEEPFQRLYPPTEEGPRVAVEGVETPEGRRIVLFTTEPIALREANGRLQEEGFRGVMRLDEVQQVNAIPVLGTGKTDYKMLRARITCDPSFTSKKGA
jgi:long-chain-fatty-acid--[acyl-carrier-protein] ligase